MKHKLIYFLLMSVFSAHLYGQDNSIDMSTTHEACTEQNYDKHAFTNDVNFDDADVYAIPVSKALPRSATLAVEACIGLYNLKGNQNNLKYYSYEYQDSKAYGWEWLENTGLSNSTQQNLSDPNVVGEASLKRINPPEHDHLGNSQCYVKTLLEDCLADFDYQYVTYQYNQSQQRKIIPSLLTMAAVEEAIPLDINLINWLNLDLNNTTPLFSAELKWNTYTAYESTKEVFYRYAEQTTALAQYNPGYASNEDENSGPVWSPRIVETHKTNLVDYIFYRKLFAYYLPNACVGGEEHDLFNEIAGNNPWPKPIAVYGNSASWHLGGSPFESMSNCSSEKNMGMVPTRMVDNLSFFSSRKDDLPPLDLPVNEHEKIEYNEENTYVAVIVGDGDNIGKLFRGNYKNYLNHLALCANKACPKLTWSISPQMLDLAPEVLEWWYRAATEVTGTDYFTLPPSGYLYSYPGTMPEHVQYNYVDLTSHGARELKTRSTVHWDTFIDTRELADLSPIDPIEYTKYDTEITQLLKQAESYAHTWNKDIELLFDGKIEKATSKAIKHLTNLTPSQIIEPMKDFPRNDVKQTFIDSLNLDNYTQARSPFLNWQNTENNFIPKYGKEGQIKGVFEVNVPYSIPTFTWLPHQWSKVKGNVAIFRPRPWRGTDPSHEEGFESDLAKVSPRPAYISAKNLASEIKALPKGTLIGIYTSSDGGLGDVSKEMLNMLEHLPKHVKFVSADELTQLASKADYKKIMANHYLTQATLAAKQTTKKITTQVKKQTNKVRKLIKKIKRK